MEMKKIKTQINPLMPGQVILKDMSFYSPITCLIIYQIKYQIQSSNILVLEINTKAPRYFLSTIMGTYTTEEQSINFHTHSQLNISFAYYLFKTQ